MYNDNKTVQTIADGLQTLSQTELQELDRIITPRAAVLLAKAFGPEIGELLTPLTKDDVEDSGSPAAPVKRSAGEGELRQLMRDPRYWRDHDPQYVDMVSQGFRDLYPGGAV